MQEVGEDEVLPPSDVIRATCKDVVVQLVDETVVVRTTAEEKSDMGKIDLIQEEIQISGCQENQNQDPENWEFPKKTATSTSRTQVSPAPPTSNSFIIHSLGDGSTASESDEGVEDFVNDPLGQPEEKTTKKKGRPRKGEKQKPIALVPLHNTRARAATR